MIPMKFVKRLPLAALLLAAAPIHAAEVQQALLRCAALSDVSARLGCFDAVAKDAAAPVADVAPPAAQMVPGARIERPGSGV